MTPVESRRIGRIFFLVMLGTMGALLLWDSVAQFGFGLKYTVSWAIWEVSVNAPIIPFLAGFILGLFGGHLFWSGYADAQKDKAALKAVIQQVRDVCNREEQNNFIAQWIKKYIDESKALEIE